jgi:PKHD-type hydroxylase
MLIAVEQALPAEQVSELRTALRGAGEAWVDGRATAGYQGAPVKFNQQIDEASDVARRCQQVILAALERHPLFISAALPNLVYPPMFNRYGEGMTFGAHVDGGVRLDPATGRKLRTDISATLFLSDPDDYDGGELEVSDTYGAHSVKLAAGDMILYPATSLHHVRPVTRGARIASFFWIQSMIRDDGKRTIMFDLDNAIQRLNIDHADHPSAIQMTGVYHNLLRRWADA